MNGSLLEIPSNHTAATEDRPRVAIVGAGPAGCAAACALGRAGVNAILIERGKPGKDKPCGDAFVGPAIKLLARYHIDVACIEGLGGRPFERIDLCNEESVLFQHKIDDQPGWIIPRALLDQKLRDETAKHATVLYETLVKEISQDSGGVWHVALRQDDLTIDWQFDAVVLASGANNQFAKKWGICGEPLLGASISGYADKKDTEAPIFQFLEPCQPGYGWVFPVDEKRVNVGVCSLKENNKDLRKLATGYLDVWDMPQSCKWRGGGEPLWSGKGGTWHHRDGMVSCGDTAGLVDPITAEGISGALISGERAGNAVSKYLEEGKNSKLLEEYSKWVQSFFSKKYAQVPLRQVWSKLCGIHP